MEFSNQPATEADTPLSGQRRLHNAQTVVTRRLEASKEQLAKEKQKVYREFERERVDLSRRLVDLASLTFDLPSGTREADAQTTASSSPSRYSSIASTPAGTGSGETFDWNTSKVESVRLSESSPDDRHSVASTPSGSRVCRRKSTSVVSSFDESRVGRLASRLSRDLSFKELPRKSRAHLFSDTSSETADFDPEPKSPSEDASVPEWQQQLLQRRQKNRLHRDKTEENAQIAALLSGCPGSMVVRAFKPELESISQSADKSGKGGRSYMQATAASKAKVTRMDSATLN